MMRDDAFWAKVDKSGECWIWTGAVSVKGYGRVIRASKALYAHRHALTLVGVDVTGRTVDHICHQVACVRPEHLRCVTPKQNNENRAGAQVNSASGVRGVYWDRLTGRWSAEVTNGNTRHRRRFPTLEDAAEWTRLKRLEVFTHSDMDRVA